MSESLTSQQILSALQAGRPKVVIPGTVAPATASEKEAAAFQNLWSMYENQRSPRLTKEQIWAKLKDHPGAPKVSPLEEDRARVNIPAHTLTDDQILYLASQILAKRENPQAHFPGLDPEYHTPATPAAQPVQDNGLGFTPASANQKKETGAPARVPQALKEPEGLPPLPHNAGDTTQAEPVTAAPAPPAASMPGGDDWDSQPAPIQPAAIPAPTPAPAPAAAKSKR